MNNHLEVRSLSKHFPSFLLDGISFSLPQGYIMGLVGPNGAGKTTIIHLILNLLAKDEGEILVFGLDHIKHEIEIKQNVGVVFDRMFFAENWTVKGVEKAISVFYRNWDQQAFASLLQRFGLPTGKKIAAFSRGMQMKLMLATALAHKAKLLILDEPTSGLDAVTRDELSEVLQEYIEDGERSVLFSTHISSDLERIADYIAFLNEGRLLFQGPLQDLMDSYRMVKGRPSQLTSDLKKKIIGLRSTEFGFQGLLKTKDSLGLPALVVDEASLDDIVIYASKRRVGV